MSFVSLNIEYFPDPTRGVPVYKGYVYVGEPNTDPEVPSNQKTVTLLKSDGTEVATAQPLRTGAGGVVLYDNSPVQVLVEGSYSLKVLDKHGNQVYYVSEGTGIKIPGTSLTLSTLKDVVGMSDGELLSTSGRVTPEDQGGGVWVFDSDDLSANVTNDPSSGIYAAPYSDPTGASGAWVRQYNGALYVAWFGAVGDGLTDDTLAIQAAIDASEAGGTVLISGGDYLIQVTGPGVSGRDGGIIINKSLKLGLSDDTILRAITGTDVIARVLAIEGCENVEVYGGTIIGDRDTNVVVTEQGSGLEILNSSYVYVHDMFITMTYGDGIRATPNIVYPHDITIQRVTVDQPRRWGMSFSGGGQITVRECIFQNANTTLSFGGACDCEDTYQSAYGGDPMRDIVFENNQFIDNISPNGGLTFQLEDSHNIRIAGNIFRNNTTYGVNLAGNILGGLVISDNLFEKNGILRISGKDNKESLGGVISGNSFIGDGSSNAISLGGGALRIISGINIIGNTFNNLLTGIFLSLGTVSHIITDGNTFKDVITLGGALPNAKFINNKVIGVSGELRCSSVNMLTSGNTIETTKADTNGIRVSGENGIVTDNIVVECSKRGIHLDVVASNCLVANNIIQASAGAIGMLVQASSSGLPSTILNNQILDTFITPESIDDENRYLRFAAISHSKANSVPITGLFTKGAEVKNGSPAIGSPIGWVCTAAGAAVETTRVDSTAYVVGQWVRWSSGNTAWKCTVAGTSDVAAPSIVGLVVGDTVTDGTVTWQMKSLTTATLVAEANL